MQFYNLHFSIDIKNYKKIKQKITIKTKSKNIGLALTNLPIRTVIFFKKIKLVYIQFKVFYLERSYTIS